jgi:DNA-binding NarL/FixJ family response regulator
VVADDWKLLREGVAELLGQAGLEVVGRSGDADDRLRKVGAHRPHVAVVDVRMPPTHTDEGLRAAAEIRGRYPDTGVLILSQYMTRRTPSSSSPTEPTDSVTCSRTASPTSIASSTPFDGSEREAPCSIPRSW